MIKTGQYEYKFAKPIQHSPISELAATRTFPPPSMKAVMVSMLMLPPKSVPLGICKHKMVIQEKMAARHEIQVNCISLHLPLMERK